MDKEKKQPNIIVILADDLGEWALGCTGNPDVKTPHIDRLANRGVRLTNFFCTSPVCSPARASLLTGQIPSQHGVHDWLLSRNKDESSIEYLQGQIGYTDILRENGYVCGLSGKWHLGNSQEKQKGFEDWYVHAHGGGPYYQAEMIKDGQVTIENEYITDVITDNGLQFLDKYATGEQPFYLGIHYTAPHSPWINQHPQQYVDLYDETILQAHPKNEEHPWSTTKYRENHYEHLRGYFASITAMDDNIGRIIQKVEDAGLREDTVIWFLSDNGLNFGQHGIWGKGNGTFPQNMYDTSIKIPAIASHPSVLPEGKLVDSLVSGYDFMPTLLAYAGIEYANPKLPGRSFCDEMVQVEEKTSKDEKVVVFDEYGPVRMIRTKEFKYVHRYPHGPHELYDLIKDPEESSNVINHHAYEEIQQQMSQQLNEWFLTYVHPEMDGIRRGVTGAGQKGEVGLKGEGKNVFANWPTP